MLTPDELDGWSIPQQVRLFKQEINSICDGLNDLSAVIARLKAAWYSDLLTDKEKEQIAISAQVLSDAITEFNSK